MDERLYPGNTNWRDDRERAVYLIFYGLWLAWVCYLGYWVLACLCRIPTDGSAYAFSSFGVPAPAAYYLIGCLELFGGAMWAAAGALILRLVCGVMPRITGNYPSRPADPVPKWAKYAWLGIFASMLVDAVACSVYAMLPVGAMLMDDRGAGPLLAVFTGPILFMACAAGCVLCAAIAAVSVPLLNFIVRSSIMTKNGMDGKGMPRQ